MAENLSKKTLVGAFFDFIILVLLVGAAGFGGYFWGINQKLAPIQMVAPGTPGAVSATGFVIPGLPKIGGSTTAANAATSAGNSAHGGNGANSAKSSGNDAAAGSGNTQSSSSSSSDAGSGTANSSSAAESAKSDNGDTAAPATKGKVKYWLTSSGADYCGYSITVQVNGQSVDSFFGPDKLVDITRLVHKGQNTLQMEAKYLGEQYNKHPGDKNYKLTIKLVKGPHVQDDYQAKDVLTSYTRNAGETQDVNDTLEFVGD
ncbi:MAG: hypothetical protein IPO31_00455 [Candidatus Obscuribacter sp.]|nr:hypothetical protein [Candidatus Obscuribacter sp.]